MTMPFAIFGCFSVLVFALLAGFLSIYFKEFSREEKVLQELAKEKSNRSYEDSPIYYLVSQPLKNEEIKPTKTEKSKKNYN